VVLDVFSYAIHFDLGFVHHSLRVVGGNTVDFTVVFFLLREGPLTNADANLHLLGLDVLEWGLGLRFRLLDHQIEINVQVLPSCGVGGGSVRLRYFCLLEFLPSFLPLELHLLYIVHHRPLLLQLCLRYVLFHF